MLELLSVLLNVSVIVFAVSSMLMAGVSNRLADILRPLRDIGAVLRVLVANFVLVPLLAVILLNVFEPPIMLSVGLFLAATAAGAPFLIKLAAMAEADGGLSTTLLLILLPVTIVYMPIVVPLALPQAELSAVGIAQPLVLTMLVPLAVGALLRIYAEHWALASQPALSTISSISLVALIVATILANLPSILEVFRSSAILVAIIIILGAFGIGYVLGTPDGPGREVLALGTAQRNISAATVVATQAVSHPATLSMVIVTALVGWAVLFPLAAWLRRRVYPTDMPPPPGG